MATYTGADKAISFLFDIAASIAAYYSSASTYAIDTYAIHDGTLYKCISAISTPEDFTPAHWQAVLVMDEVAAGGGGGGGGTTVIANPAGAATDTLNKLQVGSTIYDVPSGGGSSGHTYSTTEQIVGTWIDGKTIYERTYTGLSISISADNRAWVNTGIDATGVSVIIGAFCIDGSGQYYPTQVVIFGATQTFGISFQCHTNRDITTLVLQYAK